MRRTFLFLCFAVFLNVVSAQEPAVEAPSTSSSPPPTAIAPEFGIFDGSRAWTNVGRSCIRTGPKKALSGLVVLVGYESCSIGSNYTQTFVRVLSGRDELVVEASSVQISEVTSQLVKSWSQTQIDANKPDWHAAALSLRNDQVDRLKKRLEDLGKRGIVVLDSSVYDVSEHTDGTGFRVQVFNPTTKTIKYVTFEIVGLNAVDDPVRDRVKGATVMRLRGIGPIEPDRSASYDQDYMWMTDVVEYHKISAIRIEYMDGTSRLVRDVDKTRLTKREHELMTLE